MKNQSPIPRRVKIFILCGLAGIWLTGCLGSSSDPILPEDFIQIISIEPHGSVLADEQENVLYFFTPDIRGESQCEGDCINSWPVFFTLNFEPATGLDGADLDVIGRPDGSNQTTFKGWPLYYFAGDDQPRDVNGDGFGGRWYVANPDYSLWIAEEQLIGHDGNPYTSDYEEGEEATTFFTDADGRTLYRFVNDTRDTNNFTDEDFSNNGVWPIFHADLDALPSGMNEEDFGEIMVHGEEPQLTYRGWPLYYFGQDEERGETKGVSFPVPGIWPVINGDTPEAP